MRVVVVGGGFGGLSAAARLAKLRHDVVLLESSAELGGSTVLDQGIYPITLAQRLLGEPESITAHGRVRDGVERNLMRECLMTETRGKIDETFNAVSDGGIDDRVHALLGRAVQSMRIAPRLRAAPAHQALPPSRRQRPSVFADVVEGSRRHYRHGWWLSLYAVILGISLYRRFVPSKGGPGDAANRIRCSGASCA